MSLPIKLKLPEHFLEPEVRCGYEVSAKLKKIWAVELDLLQHLLDVCKKHNINVQVFAGTLLGAVRHKGFIPWDDDVDVAMTREDFYKLCRVAPDEFKKPYFFQTVLTDPKYFFGFGRLRNDLTTGIVIGDECLDYHNGIYIDVFRLDGLSDSKILNWLQLRMMVLVVKCCTTYKRDTRKNNGILELCFRMIRPVMRIAPFKWWYKIYDHVLSIWTRYSSRIGLRTHFKFGEKYCIEKSELRDTIELPFENIMVPVPRQYHNVLTRIYGNYMEFPPMEQRGKWHEGKIHFEPDIPYEEYLKGKRTKDTDDAK